MTTRILLICSILVAGYCGAQSAPVVAVANPAEERFNPKSVDVVELAKTHNRLAIGQITATIGDELEYPTEMLEEGLSGKVTLSITIDGKGHVKEVVVHQSELPASYEEAALNSLKSLKKISLTEKLYYGPEKILVPIAFSL